MRIIPHTTRPNAVTRERENHTTRPNALTREDFLRIKGVLLQGAFRESNSRPLAPEARIIPLDQMPLQWIILRIKGVLLQGGISRIELETSVPESRNISLDFQGSIFLESKGYYYKGHFKNRPRDRHVNGNTIIANM